MTKKIDGSVQLWNRLMPKGRNLYRLLFHLFILTIFVIGLPLLAVIQGPSAPNPPFGEPVRPPIEKVELFTYWLILTSTIVPFYLTHSYYLIPKYLIARRYLNYAVTVFVSFAAAIVLSKSLEHLLFAQGIIENRIPVPAQILPMTLLLGVSTSFEMILNWEYQKRTQESIEKEKISAELSFLKSQINPHFLFNTLNNIYSLAERNSEKTGQSILLLSNLMRYILYDTRDGKIMLKNEIKHLEEYIALQRMRVVEERNVSIRFDNSVGNERVLIEPLMFIPFVENAFKHGISYTNRSFIHMTLSLNNSVLLFKISNSKRNANGMKIENLQAHGVGIVNTKRRLDLLYPNRHELTIFDILDSYTVQLTLHLESSKDFV